MEPPVGADVTTSVCLGAYEETVRERPWTPIKGIRDDITRKPHR